MTGALVAMRTIQCRACGAHTPVNPARFVGALALDLALDLERLSETLRAAALARDPEGIGGCLAQLRRIVAHLRSLTTV